ncbi:DUF3810 domain-containing protein [Sunxiuqinia sp. sy24]|uniref:DUF3810 domain-containing protein n=1 Tax=Sunxiuqinia sp. sy24 TaxID=3461495 RepID=UPI00404633C0
MQVNRKERLKRIFGKRWLALWLAVLTFLLTELLAAFPTGTEAVYARGIYPHIATFLSAFSCWFHFSLDDLLYVALILLGGVSLLALIFRRINWRGFVRFWLNTLALFYVLFYWLWGFNYYRLDLNERLQIAESVADTDVFVAVWEDLISQTNKSYLLVDSVDFDWVDERVEASYEQLAPFLEINYAAGMRRAKAITFSGFFAKAGISGYYGPFFNEVQLNRHLLPVEYPLVLAHEKAHQLGITSEAEANFYAWMVCSQSSDQLLQYSANLYLLRYFIYEGYQLEAYAELVKQIEEPVKADFRRIREHWLSLRNVTIDQYASKVNDAYLKTNKVEKGIEDYTGVVKFVMDFSVDSLATQRVNQLLKP